MKRYVLVFSLFAASLASPVLAAELLDVKPVVTGSIVLVEVTADIPMTYTYYNVPGEARAVVDIADADPEKIEPLIVVNKGAVASIGVDKLMIGDMVVSRLVFNLASKADIAVNHSPDRKTLHVSFGGGQPFAVAPAAAPSETETEPVASSVFKVPPRSVAAPSHPSSKEDEEAPGLDKPRPAAAPAMDPAPSARRSIQLDPLVPVTEDQVSPSMHVVKGIVIGASFIEIQTNGTVENFKMQRLAKPERLLIEIPGTSAMGVTSVPVQRFGLSKIRIGATPGFVRVVLDAGKSTFPRYEIVSAKNGVRINLK